MKLKFFKAQEIERNVKATVHASGKLGFSSSAKEKLKIDESKYIAFAANEDDSSDENLYALVFDKAEEGAFKVSKAGDYYYVNTKALFDTLGIDYKKKRVIFDIVIINYNGDEIVKLIKREIRKKKKDVE